MRPAARPYRTSARAGRACSTKPSPASTNRQGRRPRHQDGVMTGGGNDILQDPAILLDCFNVGTACKQQIDKVGVRFKSQLEEAAADGVQDVVIVMYGRGTALGAGPVDYVWQTVKPLCDNAPVNCIMVNPDKVAGMTMAMRDGIHPTDAGFDQLGNYVYELMQREGMRR